MDRGQEKKVFDHESQAVQWLRQQEPSVRSTGADLAKIFDKVMK